ncbi:MAG: helix-turn-helix transcriptional regulator [Bdellovibrio sp.]
MKRSYLKQSKEAVLLLGQQIKLERKQKKMSEFDLADRSGIARSTLQRIEKGDPSVEVGIVFNVAVIVGIQLFDVENNYTSLLSQTQDKLKLLPKRIRKNLTDEEVYDDF